MGHPCKHPYLRDEVTVRIAPQGYRGVEGEGQGRCADGQGGVGACVDVAVGGGCQPGVRHLPVTEPGGRAFGVKHSYPDSALAQ